MKLPYLADMIGVRFAWMGRDPSRALDCNGVILEAYKRSGVRLPDPCDPDTPDDAFDGLFRRVGVPPWEQGDVLIFCRDENINDGLSAHAGLYVGAGCVLHSTVEEGTRVEPLPLRKYTVLFAHRLVGA